MAMSLESQASLIAQTRESQLSAIADAINLDTAEASIASDIDLDF